MTFTTKNEADADDKMLDIADDRYEYIDTAGLDLTEGLREELSLFLARNRDQVMNILKGVTPKDEPESAPQKTEGKKKKPATKASGADE
jgi:dsDNA-binding SOS-regulon protein